MRPLFVVLLDPQVQIGLQFLPGSANLLPKGDLIDLLQHRLVETFADAIGLRASCLGPGVIDVLDREVELVLVVFTDTDTAELLIIFYCMRSWEGLTSAGGESE
jgi:hypothetical protein